MTKNAQVFCSALIELAEIGTESKRVHRTTFSLPLFKKQSLQTMKNGDSIFDDVIIILSASNTV